MKSYLSDLLPDYQVHIAFEGQDEYYAGEYYAGLVRQINKSALIHADYAPYDAPDWQIGQIIAQIAWNVSIIAPDSGGECIVYNKPWDFSQDEPKKIQDSYGYHPEVVAIREHYALNVKQGDSYFFNSRNFHEVRSCSGNRVTVSCFIGLTNNHKILIWS